MSIKKFSVLFVLTLLCCFVVLFLISFNSKMYEYLDVSYYAVPAFGLLSLIIYFLTLLFEKKKNKTGLFNIVIINTLLKFVISIGVVFLYYNNNAPSDGIFVVPFIVVYVVFTIFEAYFMSEQARPK